MAMDYGAIHIPVLLQQTLEALAPIRNGYYLDATLGLGGHAAAILKAAEGSQICGLDRDEEALALARKRLESYGGRAHFFHMPFSHFESALTKLGWQGINGALADLGVSSLQLDKAVRGFSFRNDGPLDMRMNREEGATALDLVNKLSHAELAECIAILGEDPQAKKIARKIIEARQTRKIETTLQLAEIVANAYPPAWRRSARNHPATRVFQALRLKVNDELGELERFLASILQWLLPNGRLVCISFHSLEDRIVKHVMRKWALESRENSDFPQVRILYKKPVRATEEELALNPRASSAKLRAIQILD